MTGRAAGNSNLTSSISECRSSASFLSVCRLFASITRTVSTWYVRVAHGIRVFCGAHSSARRSQTLADALANITSTSGDRDMFLRSFWEAQMHAYEHAAGWVSPPPVLRGRGKRDDAKVRHDTSVRADLLEFQDRAVSTVGSLLLRAIC